MKTIINTAYITAYKYKNKIKLSSNPCVLHLALNEFILQGKVICCNEKPLPWSIYLVEKCTDKIIFKLHSSSTESFCFEPDCQKQYSLYFCANEKCILQLYNTPECIIDIQYKKI